METRFVYILIVKWPLRSACFNQYSNDTNLHFRGQTHVILKNKTYLNVIFFNNTPIRPSKSLLKSPSGEGIICCWA